MQRIYKFSMAPQSDLKDTDDVVIDPTTPYDMMVGYGFATSTPWKNEDLRDSWPGEYFYSPVQTFLVDVPYGNYLVSVTLGDAKASAMTTIKTGLGHLMLHNVSTAAEQFVRESFAVHVEDGQLKLAFGGDAPRVRRIEIEQRPDIPTIFLAGDSTMSDQPSGGYPYTGWGQMLPAFLTSAVAVYNQARSGRSSKSFIDEGRLHRIWKKIRPGDYLFVQFAHNDEKDNDSGTQPYTTYKWYLKLYIEGARRRGATPVLISPVHRRFFDEFGRIRNTHGDYIEAMHELASEEQVPYLDLAAKSKAFFERTGEETTKDIFMWLDPNERNQLQEPLRDNTHFSEYGGIQIARLASDCIRESDLQALKSFLRDGE